MLRDRLTDLVSAAIDRLIDSSRLPAEVRGSVIEISDTKQPEHGDYACNFAMVAAKKAGKNPRELGDMLATELIEGSIESVFASVEVAGPGFLNLRIKPEVIAAYVPQVLNLDSALPNTPTSQHPNTPPQRINVEFVSVNPNGPITVGNARGAAYGSALSNVLEAAGNHVHREYYINDGINSEQMRLFAESVRAHVAGLDLPPGGYKGEYVLEIAKRITHTASTPVILESKVRASEKSAAGDGDDPISQRMADSTKALQQVVAQAENPISAISALSAADLQRLCEVSMIQQQWSDLRDFGVKYDTWFSEQSLHDSGEVARCVEAVEQAGAADTEPYRTVLKLARGGAIEEVEKRPQSDQMEEDAEPPRHDTGSADTLVGAASEVPPNSEAAAEPPSPASSPSSAQTSPQGEGVPGMPTLWLRSTKFGDDMDRVLRRKDGRLTYIASDIAYHKDKFNRGSKPDEQGHTERADRLITILGPDHHGYIHRLTAVVAAMFMSQAAGNGQRAAESPIPQHPNTAIPLSDIDSQIFKSPEERDAAQLALRLAKEKLEVQIYQLVRFLKDGKPAPMRKRDGNIYALIDLINEIGEKVKPNGTTEEKQTAGKDVARFFYLMRSHDTTFDFDLDLAEKQSDENPVFYVQYAHARIASVLRKAAEAGIEVLGYWGIGDAASSENSDSAAKLNAPIPQHLNTSLLTDPRELALIKKILDLPWEVKRAAEDYGVHRLTTYAIELARSYHYFYDACRVIQPDQPELTQARLALCRAAQIGLKATLDLLGVSAPERMDRAAVEADGTASE